MGLGAAALGAAAVGAGLLALLRSSKPTRRHKTIGAESEVVIRSSVPPPLPGESVTAALTYQDESVHRSCEASGLVYTSRDGTGTDGEYVGCKWAQRACAVYNGRGAGHSLDQHGFTLLDRPTALLHQDFYDEEIVVGRYYSECEELVKQHTGAELVVAFDHNVRSKAQNIGGRQLAGGNAVQGPAFVVHNDYSAASAPRRLEHLARPPAVNDTLYKILEGRPLLDPETLPSMMKRRSEAILIKCWDSRGESFSDDPDTVAATCSFHTAFDDPSSAVDAHDRESIEIRTIVFYGPEDNTGS